MFQNNMNTLVSPTFPKIREERTNPLRDKTGKVMSSEAAAILISVNQHYDQVVNQGGHLP
jgi:hypothetical protein